CSILWFKCLTGSVGRCRLARSSTHRRIQPCGPNPAIPPCALVLKSPCTSPTVERKRAVWPVATLNRSGGRIRGPCHAESYSRFCCWRWLSSVELQLPQL